MNTIYLKTTDFRGFLAVHRRKILLCIRHMSDIMRTRGNE